MAVQADVLPIPKMVLTLVLFAVGSIVAVFTGQAIYLAVQDVENTEKLIEADPGMIEYQLEQDAQLEEYRVVDPDSKHIAIPIEEAMKLVGKELGRGDN